MDMLEIIRTAANRKRSALMQSPIGEFAVLGLLLAGVQVGLSNIGPDSPAPQTESIIVSQKLGDSLTPAFPESITSQLGAAEVDRLVDLINPVDTELTKYQTIFEDAYETSFAAEVASRSKVPATILKPDFSTATSAAVKNNFQFSPSLGSSFSRQARANLFQADALPDNQLAIWDINKRFALANKSVKKAIKTAVKKQPKPKNRFVVMIDPGHGGSDPGSIGHNGLQEKVLTLDIAKRAQALLSDLNNVSVLLTRNDDTGMSRKTRVHKVKRSNADMVVSLHLNHLPQTDVNLVETFYAAPHNILESIEKQQAAESNDNMIKTKVIHNHDFSFTKGSRRLASMMQQRVFNEVVNNNPDTDNAGVKEDTLYILTRSFTPGVLIEMSCLSNIREAERLKDVAYRNRLAAALADGIRDYLSTPAATSHLGPEV